MKKLICLAAVLIGGMTAAQSAEKAEKPPIECVDPTIGTAHCRWFFFTPGAMPFGMAKPGPCTDAHYGNSHGWEAVGYDSRHDSIESFVSFREFQIGGIAVMATTGPLQTIPGRREQPDEGYRSRFEHKDEVAQPGYYAVQLTDYGIKAEVTATPRVAFHRFTFPAMNQAHIILDVGNRQGESGPVLDAGVRRVSGTEVEGFVITQPVYVRSYQPGASVKMYFVARLSEPASRFGAFRQAQQFPGEESLFGPGAGLYLSFEPKDAKSVEVALGLSFTSIENARFNLQKEAAGLSFDQARTQAQDRWSEMLGRIQVSGGQESDRIKFYTALYHVLLGRGLSSDANGAYPKNDGSIGKLPLTAEGAPQYNHYNSDSVWGTFWNLNQLWALAYPDYLSEYLRCHIDLFKECGWLPDSIAAGKFVSGVGTDFMSVLASAAHNWGIRDIDAETAYAASLKNELGWQNRPIGVGKADVKTFLDRGYVPYMEKAPAFSGSTADGSIFSASHTLEYSFSAYAVAQFARSLGKTADYEKLMEYSRGWQKLYDSETHFIRPRTLAGEFIAEFDPKKPWVGFQEGNAWQYTFYVPHDIPGLASRMGERTFQERLASVFQEAEKTKFGGGEKVDAFAGLQNVYNHGNQPSLHIAWLFNAAQQPWMTQHWIRRICDVFYGTNRIHGYGYGQDEDQGQLGAWFVLAGIGLFDIQGGTAPDPQFQLSSPLFEEVRIQLQPRHHAGQAFTIKSKGIAPDVRYIQSARLDGQEHSKASIPWKAVAAGATLSLELGPEPNKSWGLGK